ncbi:MAG: tRNA lysidine(34) synthetase TilS [Candidatus Marinimicrobia bacterium]|nr:tRNA lysidine(34) synthetase TilS [Candidatus Neomarinimicrobiota bacterium]
MKLCDRVKKFSDENRLFDRVKNIIVGVSGGVDSMSLLHILKCLSTVYGFILHVAHLNHLLRGELANRDENLVEQFCKDNNIDFHVRRINIREFAEKEDLSLEMAGRKARYNFFHEISLKLPNSVIATGHTLDDHIETVLLRFFKGTGIEGLRGIPIKEGNIIRPIRFVRKYELYRYARENKIPFNEDHTNYLEIYQRNIIRHVIIPRIIKDLNPNVVTSINNVSQIADEFCDYVNNTIDVNRIGDLIASRKMDSVEVNIKTFKNLHPFLGKIVLRRILLEFGLNASKISFDKINKTYNLIVNDNVGKRLDIGEGIRIYIDRERFCIKKQKIDSWECIAISVNSTVENEYFIFKSELINKNSIKFERENLNVEFIDYDKVIGDLKLRKWKRGDKIKPLGMNGHKKVSDIYVDKKVPFWKKDMIPLLVDSKNIIWVCGLVLSEDYKIDDKTKNVLKVEYYEK